MTPKEKAFDLVDRFYYKLPNNGLSEGTKKRRNEAKQCALICVDEILKDNPNIYDSDRLNHKYWNEVKTEIEKL